MKIVTNTASAWAFSFTCLMMVLLLAYNNGLPATCSMPDANGNAAHSLHQYNAMNRTRWTD